MLNNLLTPNFNIDRTIESYVRFAWLALAAVVWILFRPVAMPDPIQIITTLPSLFMDHGLQDALTQSLLTNLEGIGIATLISLPVAYSSRIPAFRPIAEGISKLRFLSPAVFFVVLLFIFKAGSIAKLGMLVLGETFFLTSAMTTVVLNIPNEAYDEARVLRMNEWVQMWYVTIRGTLSTALECIRDIMAMGWSMLMMVEGAIRSEGGVGVLMLNQERYLNFSAVYGIALTVLAVGLVQDWLITYLRGELCPHTKL